jgi:hypothetical protein
MSDSHFEPFVHLAGLTHDDALIAWGGFFFHDPDEDGSGWGIVTDPDIDDVVPGDRNASIGTDSRSYGQAEVEVVEEVSGKVAARVAASDANHVWVSGLEPDTAYRYHVTVDGAPWADGPRRDWLPGSSDGVDLVESGRGYDHRFRTFPDPSEPAPLRFAVLGDYGVGILASGGHGDQQRRLAEALDRAVSQLGVRLVVTTGDNVYIGEDDTVAGTGNHDSDWYFSFYEPYRYVINRVPFYPGVGNHDTSDSEISDNRDQLANNFFTDLRFADEVEAGRASLDPGLYYRFGYGANVEFLCVDTTQATPLEQEFFFDHPHHRAFLEEALPPAEAKGERVPWRIPFSHHPPYCAGPKHHNMDALIERLVPLLERSGAQAMFSGHEHNFQHGQTGGVDYIVSGAAGKLGPEPPDAFDQAHTRSWAAEHHFLIVDVDADRMVIHPVTDVGEDGTLHYASPTTPGGDGVQMPIVVDRA